MKIAIVHPFMNLRGGAERKTILIARELQKSVQTDLIVFELNAKKSFTELLSTIPDPIVLPAKKKAFWILAATFKCIRGGYDVVVASNPPANIVACLTKILRPKTKIAWICNEVAPVLHEGNISLIKKVSWFLERKLVKLFDLVIANSNFTSESIQSYFNIPSHVIRSGVEISNIPLLVPSEKLRHLENAKFHLTITRIEKHKNIDLIAKIAIQNPTTKIVVAGTGIDQKYFTDSIHSLNQVEYLGSISDADKNWLLSKANIFLFLPTHEPLGVTVMEALSFNTPVVAFNAGGPKEVIIDGANGILCDSEMDYLKRIDDAIALYPLKDENGHLYIKEFFSNERMVADFKKALLGLTIY